MDFTFETLLQDRSTLLGRALIRQIQSYADMLDRKHWRVNVEILWDSPIPVKLPQVPRGSVQPQYQYSDGATLLDAKLVLGWGHNSSGWEFAQLSPEFRIISGMKGTLSFRGDMPENAVDWIENQRKGQDVPLNAALDCICLRTRTATQPLPKHVEAIAQNTVIEPAQARWDKITIPASTWTGEFLRNMQYNGPRYIELPPQPSVAFSPNVRQHLDDALRYLSLGGPNLRSVPGACLNALDGLAKSLKYDGFRNLPDVSKDITPGLPERAKLLTALKNYLNRWRHDNTESGGITEELPLITQEEAIFVYVGTSHLIAFLAQYLPKYQPLADKDHVG